MRSIHKQWRNDRGGKWDARIRWYHESEGVNIRLQCTTVDGVVNLYPKDKEEADALWDEFKENNVRPKDLPQEDPLPPNPFFQ